MQSPTFLAAFQQQWHVRVAGIDGSVHCTNRQIDRPPLVLCINFFPHAANVGGFTYLGC